MNRIKTPGIRFIVTSLCNYDCDYCHNEWEPKTKPVSELELKLIGELIGATKQLGGVEVDVTGGEPLLKPDRVRAIFEEARRRDMHTNLTTNGYFLERDGQWLRDVGLGEMHVHIPSLNPRLYRELMKGNADLSRVLRGVDSVLEGIPVIKANIPIQPGINEKEIPEMIARFNSMGITPRFIETMATVSYTTNEQRVFDETVKAHINETGVKLNGSYLWGINEYSSGIGDFETLRCICFDRKCDICPETNFVHVDQNYKIRPCNLRPFKIDAREGECIDQISEAVRFLQAQTDIPDEYKGVWGAKYVSLTTGGKGTPKDIYNKPN